MDIEKIVSSILTPKNLTLILLFGGGLWFIDLYYGAITWLTFYKFLWGLVPFLLLIHLGKFAWRMWIHYIQNDFMSGIEWIVLEVIPPREVDRSPRAMELFISNALYHWSNKGGREEFWQGAVWFWFSLEIVSIDGQVHFYIRTPSRLKGLIETQMYAQYPQAQIKLVDDYTLAVPELKPDGPWKGWGCEFTLTKPFFYPIRTYVDYGLDDDPKEEYKVDPLSPLIELFASLKKGEQMWFQVVVRPCKTMFPTKGTMFGKHDWQREAENQILDLLEPYASTRKREDLPGNVYGKEIRVPKYMDDIAEGYKRKVQKLGFDAGVRTMYIAKREAWDMSSRRNLRLIMRQFESPFLNGFKRINSTQGDAYGGIFTSSEEVVTNLADRMLGEYRARSFFHSAMRQQLFDTKHLPWPLSPYIFPAYVVQETYVLNTEEIATLWHFPGQILKVPTLERIESKEASPPPNLPT